MRSPRAVPSPARPSVARILIAIVVAFDVLTACTTSRAGDGPVPPPTGVTVVFTGGALKVEVASTQAARETGLSNRTSIAADSGMIFVWPAPVDYRFSPFWMKDTHFDLSIAFIDAQKRVINIEDMQKETLTNHFATADYQYAVEATRGWFAARGVVAGSQASFTLP